MTSKLARAWHNPWLRWGVRLVLTTLVLTLLFTRVDFASVVNTLGQVHLWPVLGSLALSLVARYVLAYQMSLGLPALGTAFSVLDLFRIGLIATFYSLLLPGDLVAGGATWFKLSAPERKGIEAGTVVVYFRLINTLTLLGVGVLGMWFDPHLTSPHFRTALVVMLIMLTLLLLPFTSGAATRRISRLFRPLWNRIPPSNWIRTRASPIAQSLAAFQSLGARTLTLILCLSLLSHALGILHFYMLTLAVGIQLSILVVGWVRSLLIIIQMMPISIAGLGVREASAVLLLSEYGIPEAKALSFSLVLFCVTVILGLLGGCFEGWDLLHRGRKRRRPVSEEVDSTTHPST